MATARPPGGQGDTPKATIGFDYSQLRNAPNVARQAAQATAREISQVFRAMQAEQRIALAQAQTTLAAVRAQQSQITATTRAESSVRMTAARREAQAQQQAARVAAATRIEEERRITAQFRSELRTREAAQRATSGATAGAGGGARLGQFAGAALGGIGGPAGSVLGGLAGGTPAIAAGLALAATARAAVEASNAAAAYNRQNLAALSLAGSQAKLNQLLEAYTRATGGAVSQAQTLADVTNLQAIGFANNAQEVERFVRAARGISIAKGTPLAEITNELALGIANQSTRRFDQLGLEIGEVNERIAELRANNAGMTREAAFQEAVLQIATEKYAGLTTAADAQATGLERLSKAWADFSLSLGQAASGPINGAAHALATLIDTVRGGLEELSQTGQTSTVRGGVSIRGNAAGAENILAGLTAARERVLADIETGARPLAVLQADLAELDAKIRAVNISLGTLDVAARNATFGSRTTIGRVTPTRISEFTPEQEAAQATLKAERLTSLQQIERDADRAIVESASQFARQRSETIASYEKSIAREAEDFGRQRANAERKLQMSILDVAQDSARQRVKWEQDAARAIEEARAERDERIAESREASVERIADIEEDFARDREKRQRNFARNIREAAANLDAVQVRELQRQRREENEEAKEAYQERIADEQESLQERIDDANKAFAKQEQDQRESLQRRIEDQAENDRLRIEEMKAAFEEQKAQEDIDRGIRLGRQAEDHNAQLAEMDRAQGERIAQIREREAEAIAETNHAYDVRLQAEGVHNAKLEAEQLRHQIEAERSYAAHIAALDAIVKGRAQGPQPLNPFIAPPGQFPSLVQPVASPSGSGVTNSRSTSFTGDINITIQGGTNMGASELRPLMYEVVYDVLEEISR